VAIDMDQMFLAQGSTLIVYGSVVGESILLDSLRKWMIPANYVGQNPVGILDQASLGPPFSRAVLNALYPLVFVFEGSAGDEMACRAQADYLSSQERAFRLRHATTVRCIIHSAGRRMGHGSVVGPLGRVVVYVQDLIVAGAK